MILPKRSEADGRDRTDALARRQIADLRGKAKASFILAVQDIRRRGCQAAGIRLAGEQLAGICRLDLYGAWRLLTVFEASDRCVLLLVAEHTRSANPYRTPQSFRTAVTRLHATPSDESGMHGKEKVYGSIP
jgi:hypothetical protein